VCSWSCSCSCSGRVVVGLVEVVVVVWCSAVAVVYLSVYLYICLSICLSVYLSVYLSNYLSICLSIYLSIYLSICKFEIEAILRDFLQFLKLTTSKTQQFCETSSTFELDNVKNEAFLRDFLNFSSWQHQKRSNSARLPSMMESWVQSWRPRTNVFCNFSLKYCACEKVKPGHTKSAAPVTQNHLSKPEDLMLQNATLLRKSPPGSPNTSNTCVSCTAPAMRNASFQIVFKCPTPAMVFENCYKTLTFCLLFTRCTIPGTCHAKKTSERPTVLRSPSVFCTFDLEMEMHFVPQGSALFRHRNFQEWADTMHFDLEMCFAPQRRALFRHRNFQKWSEAKVFCTFWLRNVLRATTVCTFSYLIWPHGSAPAALASLLFDPPEHKSWEKT